jgi:lipoyl-dependent peroxiredoxin
MSRNLFLERTATTYGGRDGIIKNTQSGLQVEMTKPLEMGGTNPTGTNPEELFSMGYSGCFASSLEYLLSVDKVSYQDITVKVNTQLVSDELGGFKFALQVHARIKGLTSEQENQYIQKAFLFCPYSKAIKGNVDISFI